MRLVLNSDLWNKIYYTLGRDALNSRTDRYEMEKWFKENHNITINTFPDGRWKSVDIDDEDLVMIMLKIGAPHDVI